MTPWRWSTRISISWPPFYALGLPFPDVMLLFLPVLHVAHDDQAEQLSRTLTRHPSAGCLEHCEWR